jgi:predicted membrane protein
MINLEDQNLTRDKIDDVAIFGGGNKIITSENFRGGNVTAVFGGSEINLMNCKLAEGENVVDMLCIFGGSTLIIPSDWNVIVSVTSIMGGFSNKIVKNPARVTDTTRSLHIKGLALFGGGEVKSFY